jgi:hypothetical protein
MMFQECSVVMMKRSMGLVCAVYGINTMDHNLQSLTVSQSLRGTGGQAKVKEFWQSVGYERLSPSLRGAGGGKPGVGTKYIMLTMKYIISKENPPPNPRQRGKIPAPWISFRHVVKKDLADKMKQQ